jgi:hypothetical protein
MDMAVITLWTFSVSKRTCSHQLARKTILFPELGYNLPTEISKISARGYPAKF